MKYLHGSVKPPQEILLGRHIMIKYKLAAKIKPAKDCAHY